MSEEIIEECKLNFKCDEPTPNGRIYSKIILEKIFKKWEEKINKKTAFVLSDAQDMILNGNANIKLEKVKGIVTDYKINENNEIIIYVKPISGYTGIKNFKLSIAGIGTQPEDFELTYLFITDEINI